MTACDREVCFDVDKSDIGSGKRISILLTLKRGSALEVPMARRHHRGTSHHNKGFHSKIRLRSSKAKGHQLLNDGLRLELYVGGRRSSLIQPSHQERHICC